MLSKLFICWQNKKPNQISRLNSHMNLFILIESSITGDSEKGDDPFFGDHHFFRQQNTISDIIDHYFMAAFIQFWQKTYINIKYLTKTSCTPANLPRHTSVPRHPIWETLDYTIQFSNRFAKTNDIKRKVKQQHI